MRTLLAVLHLLGLGIGLGAVYARARAANRLKDGPDSLSAVFAADMWWGIAAVVWIATGLTRVFGSYEKTSSYYWTNHMFMAKLGMLVVVILLEIWPMMTLIKWRRTSRDRTVPAADLVTKGRLIARISDVQTVLVVAMVTAAVLMARGSGAR